MKKPACLIMFILPLLFSCIDKSVPDFSECISSGSLEKSILETEILGTWEWQFMVCCPESTEGMKRDLNLHGGTKITLYDDGKGKKEDKSGIIDFSWKLKTVDFNYYGFDTDPRIFSISGRLFICNDQLFANDSYRDGADNYFKKIKGPEIKPN